MKFIELMILYSGKFLRCKILWNCLLILIKIFRSFNIHLHQSHNIDQVGSRVLYIRLNV